MEVYFSQRPRSKKIHDSPQHTPNRIADRKLDLSQAGSEPDLSRSVLHMLALSKIGKSLVVSSLWTVRRRWKSCQWLKHFKKFSTLRLTSRPLSTRQTWVQRGYFSKRGNRMFRAVQLAVCVASKASTVWRQVATPGDGC